MASRGEAADYYNDPEAQKGDYQMQQPRQGQHGKRQPRQQQQWNGNGSQHMPPPPTYGENFGEWQDKPEYHEAFKVEKPTWNDLWAGALFLLVFAGFVAISGLCLQSYAANQGFNGDGIYGSQNDFGLDTNTIVLFALCLAMALVLGYGYMYLARLFTKQFIWITGILNIIM